MPNHSTAFNEHGATACAPMKVHAHLVVWRFYFIPYFVGDTELAEGWCSMASLLIPRRSSSLDSFFRLKANMLHYCSPQQHSVSAFSCARLAASCSDCMPTGLKAEGPFASNYHHDDSGNRHDRLCADLCGGWPGWLRP